MKIKNLTLATLFTIALFACNSGDPVNNAIADMESFVTSWESKFKEKKPEKEDLNRFKKEYEAISKKYEGLKLEKKDLTDEQYEKLEEIQGKLMSLAISVTKDDILDKIAF